MTTATGTGLRPFLGVLFAGATGVMELRALPSKRTAFIPLHDFTAVERFIAQCGTDNLYIGVAARQDATSGKLENCSTLGAVFADVDFKQTPKAEAREALAAFPLPPTLIVHSGGGLHVYYALREPLDLTTDEPRARSLLERLAVALRGDRSAAEPARVLRVPGTLNRKAEYGTPRPVVLELCEPDRRYNPSELEEWLPRVPSGSTANGRFHAPEAPIGPGERRPYLFRLARSLKARGLTEAAVRAAAREENATRCRPPVPDDEVVRQVRSAFEQADRPGFEPRAPGEGVESPAPAWPVLAPEALYGLAGRVVEAIDPHTEADPVATLATFLVSVGNLLGPGPHARAGEDPHPARLYIALTGKTAKGRKGMSGRAVRRLLARVDEPWARTRVASGLSSGEGVIYHVRDVREERQPIKERGGRVIDYQSVIDRCISNRISR